MKTPPQPKSEAIIAIPLIPAPRPPLTPEQEAMSAAVAQEEAKIMDDLYAD